MTPDEQQPNPTAGRPPGGERSSGSNRGAGRGPREGGRGESGQRGERGGRRGPGGRRFYRRRKVCKFCVDKLDHVDYKDVKLIAQFVGDRGKILPRRLTGVCPPHQRQLKVAIKRARNIALLPFAAIR